MIEPSRWDLDALAASWRGARPFAHVAIDRLLGEEKLLLLRDAFPAEPHWPARGEIYEFMTAENPTQPALRAFLDSLGGPDVREAIRTVTGIETARIDGSSYVYLAGSFLLPHTDHREGLGRKIAYIYYLSDDDAFTGGELDFYSADQREIALSLPPKKDRLLLFEVGSLTLHRVREVRSGARVSIAGWFY